LKVLLTSGGQVKVFNFLREVKVEANKVVWPDRKEVMQTWMFVVVAAVVAAVFFLLVDSLVYKLIKFLLDI
jgi:preprotein translocase subunit SecE